MDFKNAVTEITQSQRKQEKNVDKQYTSCTNSTKKWVEFHPKRSVIILNINEPYVTIKKQR